MEYIKQFIDYTEFISILVVLILMLFGVMVRYLYYNQEFFKRTRNHYSEIESHLGQIVSQFYKTEKALESLEKSIEAMNSLIDFKKLKIEFDSIKPELKKLLSSNKMVVEEYKKSLKIIEPFEETLKKTYLDRKITLGIDELMEYTGYSMRDIKRLVRNSAIPYSSPYKSKNIYFDREKIDKWLLLNQIGDWSFLDDKKNWNPKG